MLLNQRMGQSARMWLLFWVVCAAFWVSTAARPAIGQDGAGDATGESGETTAPPPQENVLIWLAKTSGWIGAVLLGLSIYFVATVTKLFFELRPEVTAPPQILQQCDELLKAKDFMGIYKLARGDDSLYSTVLSAGLAELPQGLTEARDAMDRVGDAEIVEMEKRISMLAVLGSLGPMIGLLGTLKGMIASFSVIAMSDTQIKPSLVAGGISEALVLTFEGVGLAVPAIYFFALFRNRVYSLSTNAMLAADELIRRIHQHARQKGPAAPAGQPTA